MLEELTLDGSLDFSGELKPINAGRIITEFSEGPVELRYKGDSYGKTEAPLADATRYVQDLLSTDPEVLEEKIEQETMPKHFYLDKREEDIPNDMNSTPIPRPDHLEVKSAQVVKAGVSYPKTGYGIMFDVNNNADGFAEEAQVTFNYWDDLPNGRKLDKLDSAIDRWRDTTAYELLE